jgi:imidazole glycerol-phosphate synthase subunit HisF
MLRKRLIPVLLLKNGQLIRSEGFTFHTVIGNPIHEVERYNHWSVDEIIYLDITEDERYDIGRDDQKITGLGDIFAILDAVARSCFVPLTFGGRIRSLADAEARIRRGADKVAITTAAFQRPALIGEIATKFGSQAVVVGVDYRCHDGSREVFINRGRDATGRTPADWAAEAEAAGAGEILLHCIDRDGKACGYDLEGIRAVVQATSIPVIALGGVGRFEDFADGIAVAGAAAAAAANIFHFTENSARQAKRIMRRRQIHVR